MIESFGKQLGVPCFIYGIDDVGTVQNFSQYTMKRIHHESEGMFWFYTREYHRDLLDSGS